LAPTPSAVSMASTAFLTDRDDSGGACADMMSVQ
jgi:hypothetical protein